jgi:hypothetical protein
VFCSKVGAAAVVAVGAAALVTLAAACEPSDDPTVQAAPTASVAGEPGIRFVDVTQAEGVAIQARRSWGSTWMDHDLDGDPDLLVNRHFFPPYYFEHGPGGYAEAEALQRALDAPDFDRHACAWGDPSGDGLPDLLCTQGAEKGKGIGPNQLLIQDPDGGFEDQAVERGVAYPPARSRTANWIDYDGDHDLDLFVATQFREGYPNRMFRNDDGNFTKVRVGLEREVESEVTAWADWDQDGDQDLLVTVKDGPLMSFRNVGGRFRLVRLRALDGDWLGATFGDADGDRWPDLHLINERRSVIFTNNRGRFEATHRMRTIEGRTGVWFDVDNDTDQDLFLLRGAPGNGDDPDARDRTDVLLLNTENGFSPKRVTVTGDPQGNGDSVAVADHDRDGTLDLHVTNGYKRTAGPFLLLENRSTAGNWTALRLDGGPGNPFGMWAELEVRTEAGSYRLSVTDGMVFRSQSEVGYTHLALGIAEAGDVQVLWLDGTVDCVKVVHGTVGDLEKGGAPCT